MAFPGSIAISRKKILQFERVLAEGGILPALGFLNARVRHRYTSVCRFDQPILRSLFVFDRKDPKSLYGGTSQVLEETYAALVQRRKQPFRTDNAIRDSRLLYHSARVSVLAYIGVPIRLATGELWGVLSHHDPEARVAPVGEVELLQEVIPALTRWLKPQSVMMADVPATM
jgi:GAF domain-containing protein